MMEADQPASAVSIETAAPTRLDPSLAPSEEDTLIAVVPMGQVLI
jgi:hypothetical protein